MTRVIKLFFLLFFCTFLVPVFAADPKDPEKLKKANWNCDLDHVKYGEIELFIEDLKKKEHENPRHPAICLYSKFQNSILWRSKEYEAFKVEIVPIEGAPHPFYIEFPKGGLQSVNQLVSSGPPKRDLPKDKVL
ncbi:hypothetical protein L0156_24845, partial [bacterium]|nr:hypothetical protein [bacterium]